MKQLIAIPFIALLFISKCTTLTLQPANFSWPVESVIPVDNEGQVFEDRYSLEFNTTGLFYEELQDSLAYTGKEIRMIRDIQGFYFITASKFKNVYVFQAKDATMTLDKKIFISEFGLDNPAFNQRAPYIELIDGDKKINLTHKGIEGGAK